MLQQLLFVRNVRLFLLLSCWAVLLNSCNTDNPVNPDGPGKEENKYLVESTQLAEFNTTQVKQKAGSYALLVGNYVKYGVKVFKITYKTKNTDGADITASGVLIVPSTTEASSLISVQHGTITNKQDAPSLFKDGTEASSFGSLFGSMGYIISYPDYIGYGASESLPHPYEHRASLASASLDMLRAAKEFLKEHEEIKWNEKLYVAGYSEGGYATMSLQKKIEEEAATEFNLRASSCGAGAYDKTAFMEYIVNEPTHGIASYNSLYLWVLLTYDRIYNINRPSTFYFKEPFAAQVAAKGKDVAIAQSFNTALTDSFKAGLENGTDTKFLAAIGDNDVYNWKPKTPTLLVHGTADNLVFYFNTQKAYDTMKGLGADVTLFTYQSGDHATTLPQYLFQTLAFFQSKQ